MESNRTPSPQRVIPIRAGSSVAAPSRVPDRVAAASPWTDNVRPVPIRDLQAIFAPRGIDLFESLKNAKPAPANDGLNGAVWFIALIGLGVLLIGIAAWVRP